MNKEGKVFNKINILDLIFIVFVLFLVFLSAFKLIGKDLEDLTVSSDIVNIEVRASIEMDKGYLDVIKVGDRLGELKQYIDAYIEEVEISPVKSTNLDENGNVVVSDDPTKERAYIVLTAKAQYGNNIYKFGKQELRQGKIVFIESDFYKYKAQIESVKVVD